MTWILLLLALAAPAAAGEADPGNAGAIAATAFGVTADGRSDDTRALQAALDAGAGGTVILPGGILCISDTILVPAGTTVRGQGAGDAWGATSRSVGTCIRMAGRGRPRVWTDIRYKAPEAWDTVTDDPMTVGVVLNGSGSGLMDLRIDGGGDPHGAWDAGVFVPAVKRSRLVGVDIDGYFTIAGLYLDATWSARNRPLLAKNGLDIRADDGLNEFSAADCFFRGGAWGCYAKGTDRAATEDPGGAHPWVWAWGGVSDLVFTGCRFSNRPIDPGIGGSLYMDLGGADRSFPVKWYQNHYFRGCSFRSSGSRWSVFLDRTRFDSFSGIYGESRPSPTRRATATIDARGVVPLPAPAPHLHGPHAADQRAQRIYIDASSRIDLQATAWTPSATIAGPHGSFVLAAVGFDSRAQRAYFLATAITGHLAAGDAIEQAEGQAVGPVFYATDRTDSLYSEGQAAFLTASTSYARIAGGSITARSIAAAGLTARDDCFEGGARREAHLNCEEGSQLNLWLNRHGTGSGRQTRIRLTEGGLLPYQALALGDGDHPWSAIHLGTGAPGCAITSGVGGPEGRVRAPVGSLYLRRDGGPGTTMYVKESGDGMTGWVAK